MDHPGFQFELLSIGWFVVLELSERGHWRGAYFFFAVMNFLFAVAERWGMMR